MRDIIYRMRSIIDRHRRDVVDAKAAIWLSKIDLGFQPMPSSALSSSAVLTIINEIIINRRMNVVEFGTGISTLYFAKVLKAQGGRIVSVENDPQWAEFIHDTASKLELSAALKIIVSPLVSNPSSLDGSAFYDTIPLENEFELESIDCVVVDGPPAASSANRLSRYPALPFIYPYLRPNVAVFLDDVYRKGEAEIVSRWDRQFDLHFTNAVARGGYARGTRGHSFEPGV